jgi:hypothetical protein
MNEISSAVSSLEVPREKPTFNVDEGKAWLAWTAPISLRLVAAIGQKRPCGHHACRTLECLFVIGFSHWQLSQQTERNVDRCDGDN